MRQGRLLDLLSAVPPYTPPRGLQTDIFRKTFYTQSTAQNARSAQDAQIAQDTRSAQDTQDTRSGQAAHTAQNFTIALR